MSVQSTAADVEIYPRPRVARLARNWLRMLVIALAVAGAAFAFSMTAERHYKAEAQIKIETGASFKQGIATEVQIVSSSDILKQVALKLNLAQLAEFDDATNMSSLTKLLVIAGLRSDPQEIPAEERVLNKMRDVLNVHGVEKTGVIAIEFSSQDPELAEAVPNAIAQAYIATRGSAKIRSNSAETSFFGPEYANLQQQVKDAEAKVANYRSQSDSGVGADSAVFATQQLSELSSELLRVRATRASAEAGADSVRKALQGGGSLDVVPELSSSDLIQRLRGRRVELRASLADLSITLLDNHPRIRALKSQLADLDGQIRNEAQKVMRGLAMQAQTAQARETKLLADVNTLKPAAARASEQQVELDALQRDANARRRQLETYQASYLAGQSGKEGSYPPVDVRILSEAEVPSEPYFPKVLPTVGAAFAGSLLIMAIATLLQQLFSGRAMRPAAGARFERIDEVEMPAIRQEPIVDTFQDRAADGTAPPEPTLRPGPFEGGVAAAAPIPSVQTVANDRFAAHAEPVARDQTVTAREPVHSVLGEIGIESAAERLIASGTARAIFVSPEGDEAAASAVLVAREVSDAGLRVLLLDLTAAGAASRPMLDGRLFAGITNLLASEAQFSDVIHADLYSDCHVIPVGTADPVRAMRAADRLPIIMQSLATAYDLVVVECGPADAAGISRVTGDATEVFLSMLEPDKEVAQAAHHLIESGYPDLTLVTPRRHQQPGWPVYGRRTAA